MDKWLENFKLNDTINITDRDDEGILGYMIFS